MKFKSWRLVPLIDASEKIPHDHNLYKFVGHTQALSIKLNELRQEMKIDSICEAIWEEIIIKKKWRSWEESNKKNK